MNLYTIKGIHFLIKISIPNNRLVRCAYIPPSLPRLVSGDGKSILTRMLFRLNSLLCYCRDFLLPRVLFRNRNDRVTIQVIATIQLREFFFPPPTFQPKHTRDLFFSFHRLRSFFIIHKTFALSRLIHESNNLFSQKPIEKHSFARLDSFFGREKGRRNFPRVSIEKSIT